MASLAQDYIDLMASGGESTRGSFDGVFGAGKVDTVSLQEYESAVKKEFGVSAGEARLLAKAAYIYSSQNAAAPARETSAIERKNAVAFLLQKLAQEGVAA